MVVSNNEKKVTINKEENSRLIQFFHLYAEYIIDAAFA